MDHDTGEPKDTLTPHALHQIKALGSHITEVPEIVAQKDKAVFTAIQNGLDKVNEDSTFRAQRVGIPFNVQAELTSLLPLRVGRL